MDGFLARLLDLAQHAIHVRRRLVMHEAPRQRGVRLQQIFAVERPDFMGVLRVQQLGRETAAISPDIVDVAFQHPEGIVVARGVHGLRQVDDHEAIDPHQHVELGQIPMNQSHTQHAHDLRNQLAVPRARHLRRGRNVIEPGRRIAVRADDQLHQQHAVKITMGLGHAHPCGVKPIKRVHFGILPGRLLDLAPVLAALAQGALVTAVAGLAPFLILGELVEATLFNGFVYLGAAHIGATGHQIHRCLLAALQRPDHVVDNAIINQRLELFRDFHAGWGMGLEGRKKDEKGLNQ